ncbi:MAG TPA: tRNA 2-thiouridine(34) synthase MnmA [Ruminiclostridium sp.]
MSSKKVMLGMSGGVDSSVAAALLLQQGYEVIGVTLQIWQDMDEEMKKSEGSCCSLSAVDDARRVANKLGIPYYVLNFKDIFNKTVIEYFKEEYFKGRTPNPCIACNRHVKWQAMLDKAVPMGIDYIATGHYAKVMYDAATSRHILKKSVTDKKDQTYALYNLTQEQLSRTLMPVGDYPKDQIRQMAKDLGLSVASKPDSQEICFIHDNDYGKFLSENCDKKIVPGKFIDTNGNVLGEHKGIVHYTVGQRKGLGNTFGKPMFVVKLDATNNRVVLGDDHEVFSDSLTASDLNFISIEKPIDGMRVNAKIRYSAKESPATISVLDDNKIKVVFDVPQRAITPGQSVVFYAGEVVVGGGTID